MTPQVCKAQKYSYMSDVWSLGCVLYELCALQQAWTGNNLLAVVYKIVQAEQPPLHAAYSDGLRQVVTSLLMKDPSQRPSLPSVLALPFLQAHIEGVAPGAAADGSIANTAPAQMPTTAQVQMPNTALAQMLPAASSSSSSSPAGAVSGVSSAALGSLDAVLGGTSAALGSTAVVLGGVMDSTMRYDELFEENSDWRNEATTKRNAAAVGGAAGGGRGAGPASISTPTAEHLPNKGAEHLPNKGAEHLPNKGADHLHASGASLEVPTADALHGRRLSQRRPSSDRLLREDRSSHEEEGHHTHVHTLIHSQPPTEHFGTHSPRFARPLTPAEPARPAHAYNLGHNLGGHAMTPAHHIAPHQAPHRLRSRDRVGGRDLGDLPEEMDSHMAAARRQAIEHAAGAEIKRQGSLKQVR